MNIFYFKSTQYYFMYLLSTSLARRWLSLTITTLSLSLGTTVVTHVFIETCLAVTFITFRNEENQIISQQSREGKSWTEGIYSPYSWKEKTKGGVFLEGLPLVASLTHCKTLDRRSHPVSHYVYKVTHWPLTTSILQYLPLKLLYFKVK